MTDLVTNIIAYYPYSQSGVYAPDTLSDEALHFYDKGVLLPLFSFEESSDDNKAFRSSSLAVFLNGPSLKDPDVFLEKTGQAMPPVLKSLPFPIRQGSLHQEVELEFTLLSTRPFFMTEPQPDMQVEDNRLYVINDLREIFAFLESGEFHEELLLLIGTQDLCNHRTLDDIRMGDAMILPYVADIVFSKEPENIWQKCKNRAEKTPSLPPTSPFKNHAGYAWVNSALG